MNEHPNGETRCSCDGEPVECSHVAARGRAEEDARQVRAMYDELCKQMSQVGDKLARRTEQHEAAVRAYAAERDAHDKTTAELTQARREAEYQREVMAGTVLLGGDDAPGMIRALAEELATTGVLSGEQVEQVRAGLDRQEAGRTVTPLTGEQLAEIDAALDRAGDVATEMDDSTALPTTDWLDGVVHGLMAAKKLRAEVDRLYGEGVERMADRLLEETRMRALQIRDGSVELPIEPARELAAVWAGVARTMLQGGENYSETPVEFEVGLAGDPERYVLIVQRARGLTPHQLRKQAEGERAKAMELLGCLVDPDDCRFDHRGGCQAHGFLELKPGERCPVDEAKELLRAEGP